MLGLPFAFLMNPFALMFLAALMAFTSSVSVNLDLATGAAHQQVSPALSEEETASDLLRGYEGLKAVP
ncbi:hypothetical protein ACG93S_36360 [Streptomyces sp. WAC01490]|uniref:hypothetical protein n=1 Tax=unclassified Streptomyces TaxID=2593676 RepID=UPI003F3C0AAA